MPKVIFEDGRDPIELNSGEVLTFEGEILGPEELDHKYSRKGRHEDGREYPNPTPMAPPIGWVPTEPIHELIAKMVQNGIREQMEAERGVQLETPEEADDFDTGPDDFDPQAEYEHDFEPTMPWPASRAVRELEQQIAEARNAGRIAGLRAELEALSNGRPWPPVDPSAPAGGGGGAQPPGGQPVQERSDARPGGSPS